MEKFLNIQKIAEIMGVKPRTIYNKRNLGKFSLPLVKRGRTMGCMDYEFKAWMDRKEAVL